MKCNESERLMQPSMHCFKQQFNSPLRSFSLHLHPGHDLLVSYPSNAKHK